MTVRLFQLAIEWAYNAKILTDVKGIIHGCKAHQAELRGALQREDDCQRPRKGIS